jgi:hypothetical protein
MAVTQATFPPSPIYGLVRTSDRTAIALTRAGGEGSGSEDRRRPIQHPPTPPPVIPEFAKQMSGTQKAKQNKPSLDPGLCLRQNREDELRDFRANLSARVPSSPTLHASFSPEPRRYRSVCWAARKSDCTAIARAGPGGWEWLGLTVQPLSRDVDPGKPEQKAGRQSRLARLSSRRDHESEGLRGSAIAMRLPEGGQGLAAPKSSRNCPKLRRQCAAGEAPTPQTLCSKGAAAPGAQAPPTGPQQLLRPRMAPPVRPNSVASHRMV